jgi:hypothetical protein
MRHRLNMWPEQGSALDAELNNVAGIVQDDLYRRGVSLIQAYGKETVNGMTARRMLIGVRPDDPVMTTAEVVLEMSSRSFICFLCCGHDYLRSINPGSAN